MRIIKAAKKIDEYIATCTCCKSILGIRMSDLTQRTASNNDTGWSYSCKVCNSTNYITGELTELFPWITEDENDRQLQSNYSMRINTL